jgi:uncharacterized OB-fold protein
MALRERINLPGEAKTWPGDLPVQSLYTAGVAGDRFLKTLKEKGQFMGSPCTACGEVYVPPKLYCEKCMAELEDWVKVGPDGTLESWTEVHLGLDGKPLASAQIVGLVRLDGATTSMVHILGGVKQDDLCIGMKVTPVLKPAARREGAVTDILHFKPK